MTKTKRVNAIIDEMMDLDVAHARVIVVDEH